MQMNEYMRHVLDVADARYKGGNKAIAAKVAELEEVLSALIRVNAVLVQRLKEHGIDTSMPDGP